MVMSYNPKEMIGKIKLQSMWERKVGNQITKTEILKSVERWFKDDKNKGLILTAHDNYSHRRELNDVASRRLIAVSVEKRDGI
jgi:hypothetical protein